MAICPKCQNDISDEFGLVNCQNCGASVFVDLEGGVKLAENMNPSEDFAIDIGEDEGPPGEGEFVAEQSFVKGQNMDEFDLLQDSTYQLPQEEEHDVQDDIQEYEPILESSEDGEFVLEEETPSEGSQLYAPDDDATHMLEDEGSVASSLVESEGEIIYQEDLELQPQAHQVEAPIEPKEEDRTVIRGDNNQYENEPMVPQSSEDSLEDVKEFGNTDVSSASGGSIKIKLKISGIDDPDIRRDLREALTDARFYWNVDELMASIKSGSLVISGVNPVKASVLINRLKPVGVQLYWEQYVLQVQNSDHNSVDPHNGDLEP